MNNPGIPKSKAVSRPVGHLLDRIRELRASVGDGLNDDELTRLLRQMELPTEAGFTFLSYAEGVVTLAVPPQDLARWYPEKGWILPEKENIARSVAEQYGFSLYEPPDQSSGFLFPASHPPLVHHHLEMKNLAETVVIAHPRYLKIRLFGAAPGARYVPNGRAPLALGPALLEDLSALYQP